jgi:hypothetical protein
MIFVLEGTRLFAVVEMEAGNSDLTGARRFRVKGIREELSVNPQSGRPSNRGNSDLTGVRR